MKYWKKLVEHESHWYWLLLLAVIGFSILVNNMTCYIFEWEELPRSPQILAFTTNMISKFQSALLDIIWLLARTFIDTLGISIGFLHLDLSSLDCLSQNLFGLDVWGSLLAQLESSRTSWASAFPSWWSTLIRTAESLWLSLLVGGVGASAPSKGRRGRLMVLRIDSHRDAKDSSLHNQKTFISIVCLNLSWNISFVNGEQVNQGHLWKTHCMHILP